MPSLMNIQMGPMTAGLLSPQGIGNPQGQIPQGLWGQPQMNPQANPMGQWSQTAFNMAGRPNQGPYAPVATPPLPQGYNLGNSGGSGVGGALGGTALGLMGLLAQNPNLLKNLGSTGLGGWLSNLFGGQQAAQNYFGSDYGTASTGMPDPSSTNPGNGDNSGDPSNWQGDGSDSNPSAAGGEAAIQPYTPDTSNLNPEQFNFGSNGSLMSDAGSALGIASGLQRGGVGGYGSAALSGASLAGKTGLLNSPNLNAGVGLGADALGIYSGLKQGGVTGDLSAAANAAKLGSASGLLPAAAGTAAGYVAAPLALYNEVNNWKSGATGSDALSGAETGAAIGSIVPGIGTALGAIGGGLVGGISSLFGPGAKDPETAQVQNLINATSGNGNTSAIASQVQNPYLELAGLMDEHSSTLPMYQQFGRMGEQAFTNSLIGRVQGDESKGLTNPQQIYGQDIAPWVAGMGQGWNNVGQTYQATTQGLLQDMVNQIVNGTYQQNFKAVGGDTPFATPTPMSPMGSRIGLMGGRYLKA